MELKGEDFKTFIDTQVVGQTDFYTVKDSIVSKEMQDGSGPQVADYASYAVHHL